MQQFSNSNLEEAMASFGDILTRINNYSESNLDQDDTFDDLNNVTRGGPVHITNDDNLLSNFVHKNALSVDLTWAEKILLLEGSQTGKADCEMPPFVEYERGLFDYRQKTIRSEVIEWTLTGMVSKLLFRSGALWISGANFLTAGDYNGRDYIDNKHLIAGNERYSLDLSSRDISIDLIFENCKFYSGLNISNSYCENMHFKRCRFGSTVDPNSGSVTSINAKNCQVHGDFVVNSHAIPTSTEIESSKVEGKWIIISSNVTFEAANIKGKLEISGYEEIKVQSTSIIINGDVDLVNTNVDGPVVFDFSSILGSISGYNLKCKLLTFGYGCYVQGKVDLVFANVGIMSANNSYFLGEGTSISAGGSTSVSVMLRNCVIAYGIYFYKSEIIGDFDLDGSIVGPSNEENQHNVSVALGNSDLKNVILTDGFTCYGCVDLKYTTISGSVKFMHSNILGINTDFVYRNDKIKAINGAHSRIGQLLTFNAGSLNTIDYNIPVLKAVGLEYVYLKNHLSQLPDSIKSKIVSTEVEGFLKETPISLQLGVEEFMKKSRTAKEITEYKSLIVNDYKNCVGKISESVSMLFDQGEITSEAENETRLANVKIYLNNCIFYSLYRTSWMNKAEIIDKEFSTVDSSTMSLVIGELNLESATIDGKIDCAGAYFVADAYRIIFGEQNKSRSGLAFTCRESVNRYWQFFKNKTFTQDNWLNAINLRFATVHGSFFANYGIKNSNTPFIAEGDLDIQNAKIDKMFISISRRTKLARWKLIGTQYNYISDDYLHYDDDCKGNNKSIWPRPCRLWLRKLEFNSGRWIYSHNTQPNFRQPFEQFGNYLINSGEDSLGRDVLVVWRPTGTWLEWLIMLPIRCIYLTGRNVLFCLFFLTLLWYSGGRLYEENRVQMGAKTERIAEITFEPFLYSAERLIPFFSGDQKENFSLLNSKKTAMFLEWYHSIIHPLMGFVLISLLLVNIARLRKGGN